MTTTIYHRLYKKLLTLIPELRTLKAGDAAKSQISGFMDLNLDVLSETGDTLVIALSHYYRHPSGDMIADPDMEIRIFHNKGIAEALTYQDGCYYQCVYPDSRREPPKLKASLNSFLEDWLSNCLCQGHQLIIS